NRFLLSREQVEEERSDSRLAYGARHILIARAVATAARPMREQYDALRAGGDSQFAFERRRAGGDLNVVRTLNSCVSFIAHRDLLPLGLNLYRMIAQRKKARQHGDTLSGFLSHSVPQRHCLP